MTIDPRVALPRSARARTVTAVLGPTNTGKTHLAIERMLAYRSGVIGLPLRLLAREVYGRVVARVGPENAALITGEEKILPADPRYYVCTVEAMPDAVEAEFVAIDEVQLAGDLERGRVFTDRILRLRGAFETLLLGASTARPLLERLLPGLGVVTRPRMSVLAYAGEKKITRLPPRSAVVAFSANEVYAIAELIRRQRGGAAIVMGALSPRTRNAQVEIFQSGDVDFLIATDAIGMGLNLDVDHVAFASSRKFDGYQYRQLSAAELAQIAGRAGRHTRDGTFGVTGQVAPFEDGLVEALETHTFIPVQVFQWRNASLDFSSVAALRAALDETPQEPGLTRAPPAEDLVALDHAIRTPEAMALASSPDTVELLWEVCQIPDYRKIAPANHADLILTLFEFLARDGTIPDDWFARQVQYADRSDGDIDTLSNRIAHIRTWTYVANRANWLGDPVHWRDTTRAIEDRLSDALHERLTQRFVDRRTSVLMKRLRENVMLESEVNAAGDVIVEGQHVGSLIGFQFIPVADGESSDRKALRAAAAKGLASELERRAERLAAAPDTAFTLGSDGAIRWQGAAVARLTASDDVLRPNVLLLADDPLAGAARERAQARISLWVKTHLGTLLKPLFDLSEPTALEGVARGIAYQLVESLGVLERQRVAAEVRSLEQAARADLRALGVRFGAYHIFVPALLKPAPSQLLALLWALKHRTLDAPGVAELPQLAASGRTSVPVEPSFERELYPVVGFRILGTRAVRVDILERLADQIRPLIAWKPAPGAEPPPGAIAAGGGFTVTVAMTSLLGCSGEEFASVLKALGYRAERREMPRPAPAKAAAADGGDATATGAGSNPAEAGAMAVAATEDGAGADVAADDRVAAGEAMAGALDGAPDGLAAQAATAAPVAPVARVTAIEAGLDECVPDAARQTANVGDAARTGEGEAARLQVADTSESMAGADPVADDSGPATAVCDEEAGPNAPADPQPQAAQVGTESASAAEFAADSGISSGEAETAAATETETVVIEIWRPQRHHRPEGRGRGGRRPQRSSHGSRSPGETGAPHEEGFARHRRRRGAPPGEAEGHRAAPGGESRGERSGPRESGRDDDSARKHGRAGGGPRGTGRKGAAAGEGERRAPRKGERPQSRRSEPAVDPDSPFAKLAALKKDLEQRSREG